jgi:hypothetical protein
VSTSAVSRSTGGDGDGVGRAVMSKGKERFMRF